MSKIRIELHADDLSLDCDPIEIECDVIPRAGELIDGGVYVKNPAVLRLITSCRVLFTSSQRLQLFLKSQLTPGRTVFDPNCFRNVDGFHQSQRRILSTMRTLAEVPAIGFTAVARK
jgi:hypothetical protein